MNKTIAQFIANRINNDIGRSSVFEKIESHPAGKLKGFHQWANDRPCLGAFLVSKNTNNCYWILLVDWRKDNNFYLVIYSKNHKQSPIAEIHEHESHPDGEDLFWTYKPMKRDGANETRKNIFRSIVGDIKFSLSLPSRLVSLDDFLEDLFVLAESRISADALLASSSSVVRKTFPEGKRLERKHVLRERNAKLVSDAKTAHAKKNNGALPCEICGFDFEKWYGDFGCNYIEAHHRIPLSELDEHETAETEVSDLAMVCANCHRMLHRVRPWLSVEKLSSEIKAKYNTSVKPRRGTRHNST